MSETTTVQDLIKEVNWLKGMITNMARLHRKDVMLRYGISKSTLARWLERGRLPKPIRMGGPLWKLEDLLKAEQSGQLVRPASA